jgi:hypothetical protein
MARLYWRAAPAALARFVAVVDGEWRHAASASPDGAAGALHRRALAALPATREPRTEQVSFLLFTVTLYANRAYNLTCSP